MQIKIKKLDPNAVVPTYAHPGDAGLDLCAVKEGVIPAHSRGQIGTGLVFEIPDGYVGLVWDKGGVAYNYGITCLAGVVDAGYRGELLVVLYNTTDTDWPVSAGQKVAQLLIQSVERAEIIEVNEMSNTSRGEGRFGSTGR